MQVSASGPGAPIASTPEPAYPAPIFRAQVDAGPALPPPPPPPADAPLLGPVAPAGDVAGPRVWASLEYLLWWIKDGPLPTAGLDSDLDYGPFSGGRLTVVRDRAGNLRHVIISGDDLARALTCALGAPLALSPATTTQSSAEVVTEAQDADGSSTRDRNDRHRPADG